LQQAAKTYSFSNLNRSDSEMAGRNFLKLASEFLKRCKDELDGAFGVVMVGSASIGVVDELADVDLIVCAAEKMVVERKNSDKGFNEKIVRGMSMSTWTGRR